MDKMNLNDLKKQEIEKAQTSKIRLRDLQDKREIRDSLEAEVEEGAQEIEKKAGEISPEDRARIDEIKEKINLLDSGLATEYGVGAQKELSSFSETILSNVRGKDAGEVGMMLSDLMDKVLSLDVKSLDEKKGLLSNLPFFKEAQNSIDRLMGRYEVLEVQIDKIEGQLDVQRLSMLEDIVMFDSLYQKNLDYFKDLQLYIMAGEEKLRETVDETLPALRAEAAATGEPMDAQLVADFEDTVNRFEKKIHDLKLSKTLAIQTAPQIRLIQNNDKLLVDKIQTAILNTIPLWKSQVVIALGLQRQESALKMQQAVTETTNELLKRNSEMIRQNTIEVARESERGIVDLETLKKVNEDLIHSIVEVQKIQKEGREKRLQVEQELVAIENELKQTMLEQMDRS